MSDERPWYGWPRPPETPEEIAAYRDRMAEELDRAPMKLVVVPPPKLSPAEQERLEQIEQRAARTTQGRWDVHIHTHLANGCRCLSCEDDPTGYLLDHPDARDCEEVVAAREYEGKKGAFGRSLTGCDRGPLIPRYEDADFAAHAFSDVPFLLELLRKLSG